MRGSIGKRLTVAFIGLAIGPLLFVGIVLAWQSFTIQQQQAFQLQHEVAQRVSTQVTAFFEELENNLRLTGQVQELQELDQGEQIGILSTLLSSQRVFEELILLDNQGQERARASRLDLASPKLGDFSKDDAFVIPQTSGETYYSPIRFEETTGEPLITIAVPLFDTRNGLTDGVLVSTVRVRSIWNLIANLQVSSGQSVYIVDAQSKVVAHRDPSVVLRGGTFDVSKEGAIRPGLTGSSVVLAIDKVRLGQQEFSVVAEQTVSEALALAINTVFITMGLTVAMLAISGTLGFLIVRQIVQPIQSMAVTAQAISTGDLSQRVEITRRDELGLLANTFNGMTTQLQSLIGSLEQRVAERTTDLERRSVQLEAATQVARAAAAIRDVGHLLGEAVRLISNRFGFYHAGIFLVDELAEYAVLHAASSEGGQRMLARGHRLRVGEVGIVGNVAASGRPRIALDVGKDAVFFDNPDLPLTRSEMALPLAVRDRVIGVLDVQSTEPGAFSDEDVAILQTLADQLALAIENARLLEESQSALRELEALYGQRAREAWRERTARQPATYLYDRVSVEPAASLAPEVESLLSPGQSAIVQGEDARQLVAPIRLRGQPLGSIALRQGSAEEPWSAEELALVDEIGTQIGLALENARLFEETQLRAARLALINRITGTASAATNPDELMAAVCNEIVPAFEAEAAFLALYDEEADEIDYRCLIDKGVRRPPVRYPMDVGLTPTVVRTKKPLIIRSAEEYRRRQPTVVTFGDSWVPESWLGAPMLMGDRVIGVINVQAYRPNAWDEEDMVLLTTIADQVAVAVENVRLFQETQQRAARLTVVNRVAGAAGAALSLDELLEAVWAEINPVFRPDGIFIALYVEETNELDFRLIEEKGERASPQRNPLGGFSSIVIAEKKPLFIRNYEQERDSLPTPLMVGDTTKLYPTWLGVPLLVGDRVIGIIVVMADRPNAYSDEDELLLLTIADQVSVAVDNVRLFEEARIRAEELAVLNELAQALTARLNVEEVLEEARLGASRLVDTAHFLIGLYDQKKDTIVFAESEEDTSQQVVISADQGVSGYIIRHRMPVLIKEDYAKWAAEKGIESVGRQALSWVGAPLLVGGHPLGVMFTQSFDTPNAFDEHDRDLMAAIANQVAIALQNARLFEEAHARTEELTALNELAQNLTASTTLDEVLEEAYQGASRLLRTQSFYVGLYDPKKFEITFPFDVSASEEDQEITHIPADQGLTGYIVQNRRPVLIGDDMEQTLEEMGIESIGGDSLSWLGVPMLVGDQVMGVMVVQSYHATKAFDEHDRDLLMAVAGQTAIAIQSARLFEQAQRRAERERQIYEITSRLRRSPDINSILQTAVEELGRTLQTDRALVRLITKPSEQKSTSQEPVRRVRR